MKFVLYFFFWSHLQNKFFNTCNLNITLESTKYTSIILISMSLQVVYKFTYANIDLLV